VTWAQVSRLSGTTAHAAMYQQEFWSEQEIICLCEHVMGGLHRL